MSGKMNHEARSVRERDTKISLATRDGSGPRGFTVAKNVEIISCCEGILALLASWPEAAALLTTKIDNVGRNLGYLRSGGTMQFAQERRLYGFLKMLQLCRKMGKLPEPPDPSKRKPRAVYARTPLASFLIDPSSLPKAPPGKKTS